MTEGFDITKAEVADDEFTYKYDIDDVYSFFTSYKEDRNVYSVELYSEYVIGESIFSTDIEASSMKDAVEVSYALCFDYLRKRDINF
jgi:hypothetical protein